MKTVKSLSDLHRLAMERGSTVVVSGRTINAEAEQMRVRAPRLAPTEPNPEPPKQLVEVPPPTPVPAAEPGVPRAEVDRLLAEQEARWSRRVDELTAKMDRLPAAPAAPAHPTWNFTPEYGVGGELVRLVASPVGESK